MGDTVLANTILFVGVSVSVVLLATLFSYRFVVRDISLNLRAVTQAMQRLAAGEREARVPATERRDEIGDLARVFSVFKDQAFRVETLHRELLDKSRLLVTTFDSMNDGLTVFDEAGRLVAWNPQVLHVYGLSQRDIALGAPLAHILQVLNERGARVCTALGEDISLSDLATASGAGDRQVEVNCPDGRVVESCTAMRSLGAVSPPCTWTSPGVGRWRVNSARPKRWRPWVKSPGVSPMTSTISLAQSSVT
jgi:PAS domain-containing protein